MNNPTLTYDTTTITLPMQADWTVEPIIGENIQTSLDGSDFVDTAYRKYQYTLIFDAIFTSDYDALENLINSAIDAGANMTFVFDKFPQSTTPGVEVIARLSTRKRTGGQGQTYYSNVELTLREVNSRIITGGD